MSEKQNVCVPRSGSARWSGQGRWSAWAGAQSPKTAAVADVATTAVEASALQFMSYPFRLGVTEIVCDPK
ncbi:hypothetical protein GCM10022237_17120 [Nocardioides ginsengisoli]